MAKHVLINASLVVNSVDLSDHVESLEYTWETNDQDAAAMGDLEDYAMPSTRKLSDIKVKFYQDYASAKVYATLQPLWTNRSTFTITVKPDSGAASATNPAFSVSAFIKSAPVVTGKRGDRHMTDVVFKPAGVQTINTGA